MTGHRRQPKPKRYTGTICYMWDGHYITSQIENLTLEDIQFRQWQLMRKDVTSMSMNIYETKVGKRG